MSSREEQFNLEIEHDTKAAAARLEELRADAAAHSPDTPRASRIIARMAAVVQEELERVAAVQTRGMGGKYKRWLRAIPKDVAAVIAIRECIKGSHYPVEGRNTVQGIATSIGKAYDIEVRVREAEVVNPQYMQKVHDQIKRRGTVQERHIRNVYNVAYDRVMKGEMDSSLNRTEMLHIGKFGLDACINAGFVRVEHSTSKAGAAVYIRLCDEVQEFLDGASERDVKFVVDKQTGAMVAPPDEWTTLSDGGYYSLRRKAVHQLIQFGRNSRHENRKKLREIMTAEKAPHVFKVANYLQSRAFSIHQPTLRAIRKLWNAGGGVLGVPTKSPPKKPPCPMPDGWVAKDGTPEEVGVFSAWKREAAMFYEHEKSWLSRVREVSGFLRSAELYNRPLYFPTYCDSRGRWYYRGTPNPQGTDLAKAVLHLHTKKPLGLDGVFWLKVHIANSLGYDKERFADRARYVDSIWPALQAALDSPEDSAEVWGTDAPWCAFSGAWELREAIRSGNPAEYSTGIVCHMDATCSGLQHFSAMLRDEVGGRYVNLVDEAFCGPKQDIYSKVSTGALEAIKIDAEGVDEDVRAMALFWLKAGIPRILSKKPVMTYVYGATLRGTAQSVAQVAMQDMHLDFGDMDNSAVYAYCLYCARKLFTGIASTVPAAAFAMRWLQQQSSNLRSKGAIEWTTALGFKVIHDYPAMTVKAVKLNSCGIVETLVKEMLPGTAASRMRNAIAPNFVHSQDATHLGMTALRMQDAGLDMVGIHDSFGTHMCDVREMHKHIREAFVQMYQGKNVLMEFLWDAGGSGESPPRGNLDISNVMESEFFFC